jgi:hypothetical protein
MRQAPIVQSAAMSSMDRGEVVALIEVCSRWTTAFNADGEEEHEDDGDHG